MALLEFGLFVLLVSSLTSAQKITMTPTTTMLLTETTAQNYEFKLSAPIICPPNEQGYECAVVLLLHNTSPDIFINQCVIKWLARQWSQPRIVQIRAHPSFVDRGEKTITVRVEVSNATTAPYYTTPDAKPANIVLKTAVKPARTCSATGDPHYTTFDRCYWHQYQAGQLVHVQSVAPNRDFEVQTKTILYPARHCAVAALEDGDLVVVEYCNKNSPQISSRFTSPTGFTPRISVSGSTISIDFISGARVWLNYYSGYFDLYVTVPGVDFKNTIGLCGNNNNAFCDYVPGNNIFSNDHRELPNAMRVFGRTDGPHRDLFNHFPTPRSTVPIATLSTCDYVPIIDTFPILNPPDGEDITDNVKTDPTPSGPTTLPPFVTEEPVDTTPSSITIAEATAYCEEGFGMSTIPARCESIGMEITNYLSGCAEDVVVGGFNPDWISSAIQQLQHDCALHAIQTNQTGPVEDAMCATTTSVPCSGNGVCHVGICTCNDGFTGADCSLNLNQPPQLLSLEQVTCDVLGLQSCPSEGLVINGRNFIHGQGLVCKFGPLTTTALFLGPTQVKCAFPNNQVHGDSIERIPVSVSNNGVTFSNTLDEVFYNSKCTVCSAQGECGTNPDACVIDGICYLTGQISILNPCHICTPATSVSAWSYGYSPLACHPKFFPSSYNGRIVGSATLGQIIVGTNATNPLVADAPGYHLTYSINPLDLEPNYMNFTVDPVTGEVKTTTAFNVADINKIHFRRTFTVEARDPAGNVASAGVYVNLLTSNTPPSFNQTVYNSVLPENAQIGYHVIRVFATDSDVEEGSATIQYTMTAEGGYAGVFEIDQNTGEITVARPLDFEDKNAYILTVQALDSELLSVFVNVVINVTDVNEGPQSISLSSTTVAENVPVNSVVGVFSTVDPDTNDVFNYTLITTGVPFKIVGNTLQTTASFDYETSQSFYLLTVRSEDAGNLGVEKTFNITISNVNEPPTGVNIDGFFVFENAAAGTRVATVFAVDPEGDLYTCALIDSADDRLEIVNNQLQVASNANIDFEALQNLEITVVCADNADGDSQYSSEFQFTIEVKNIDELPSLDVGSPQLVVDLVPFGGVPEDTPIGTALANISATDPDANAEPFTLTIAPGSSFTTSPTTCAINPDTSITCWTIISLAGPIDYETDSKPVVDVIVTAGSATPIILPVPIQLIDVNEPSDPGWEPGTDPSVTEMIDFDEFIGNLLANDPDAGDSHTWVIISPTNGLITLTPGQSRRDLQSSTSAQVWAHPGLDLDYEDPTKNSIDIVIEVTDQAGLKVQRTFTINAADRPVELAHNDKPTSQPLEVQENLAVGSHLSTITVKYMDRDDLTADVTMAPSPYVTYDSETGALKVGSNIDFEQVRSFNLTFTIDFERKVGSESSPLPILADKTVVLSVSVLDVNEVPAFNQAVAFTVNTDDLVDTAVYHGSVVDPDHEHITHLTISPTGVVRAELNIVTGGFTLFLSKLFTLPSGLHSTSTQVTLTATTISGQTVSTTATITVADDCHQSNCTTPFCIDRLNGFICCPDPAFEAECGDILFTIPQANSAASTSSGAIAGIVIGALVGLVVIAFMILIIYRRRTVLREQKWADEENALSNPCYGYVGNSAVPAHDSSLDNPIYSWYMPEVSKQEADDLLTEQNEGAFIVRDIAATPGWHMLAVRTSNSIVHEKIKYEEGHYELLPPPGGMRQPRFQQLPELIEHYTKSQTGLRFTLNLDNSIYDNKRLAGRAVAAKWAYENDPSAPAVPLKQREMEMAEQLAESDDLYTNAVEAKSVLSSRA